MKEVVCNVGAGWYDVISLAALVQVPRQRGRSFNESSVLKTGKRKKIFCEGDSSFESCVDAIQ